MTFIPLEFFKRGEQEYQHSVDKALLSQSGPAATPVSSVVDGGPIGIKLPSIGVNNKGKITVTNFETVNIVLRAVVRNAHLHASTKPISEEDQRIWEVLLNTNWGLKVFETAEVFNKFIEHNGILNGTSRYKDQAHVAILATEGVRAPVNFAIDKALNWPTKLKGLKFLLVDKSSSAKQVSDQLLRTILGVSRLPEDYNSIDIETIIQKRIIKRDILKEFDDYVKFRIDHKSGIENARGPQFTNWGVRPTAKANSFGPNGMKKLFTAGLEAASLIGSPLGESFERLCILTGNKAYHDYVVRQAEQYTTKYKEQCSLNKGIPKEKRPIDVIAGLTPKGKRKKAEAERKRQNFLIRELSKKVGLDKARALLATKSIDKVEPTERKARPISMFTDPKTASLRTITAIKDIGNKSRTIAICDTWTQLLLTPFEDNIIIVLRHMFGRSTSFFNHQEGWKVFKTKIRPGIKSIDLKSWTDYLNARLQKSVVKHVFGEDIANCWYDLVVNCEWETTAVEGKIKYGTGQGMGTKGSFAIASVTDHFLSEFLLSKFYPGAVRKYPIEDLYNRVGDDLWIWDPEDHISDSLVRDYQMVINHSKSKIATDSNIVGEYVSMNMNYGVDVSRISIRNMLDIKGDLYAVMPLIHHLRERTSIDIHMLLGELYDSGIYTNKAWSNFFKGICLETIVSKTGDVKEELRQALIKLNAELNFSEHGPEPYGELRSHPDAEYIMLILMIHGIRKDASEIKSQILKLHSIKPETLQHWKDAWVTSRRDQTIWDTKLQLHELITWMQYVDSTDFIDTLDPDTIVWGILGCNEIGEAFRKLYHFREKLEEARSQLTFQNINRLTPIGIENSKMRQFIKLSNIITVDDCNGLKIARIIDKSFIIDDECESALLTKVRDIVSKLFVVSEEGFMDTNLGYPLTVYGPHPDTDPKPDDEISSPIRTYIICT